MCGISALVSDIRHGLQDYQKILRQAIETYKIKNLKFVAYIGSDFEQLGKVPTFSFDNLRAESDSWFMTEVDNITSGGECDNPVNIQFTSGTTGNPKGVTLTHHNILNNALAISGRDRINATEKDSILLNVPFYHCFGCVLGTLIMALRGTRLIIPAPTFDVNKAIATIAAEKPSILYGTPTMYVDMLDSAALSSLDLSQMSFNGIMGGSVCPEHLLLDLKRRLKCNIFVAYGTTENSPITFMSTKNDSLENKTTTVGYIMPHTEAKVVDRSGKCLAREEKGELCIRGPCTFLGYWNQEEKTNEVLGKDGWYKTGDLAIITREGYAKIVGRERDMIIR